jgi:ABC-type multidrug transport system ATPase subunit
VRDNRLANSISAWKAIVFGLLGPNGAGKTAAVRILTTLLRPHEGSASVTGIDVLRHPAQVRVAEAVAAVRGPTHK